MENEKNRVISLKTLLEIIENNSERVNKEKLIKELLEIYGTFIKKGV